MGTHALGYNSGGATDSTWGMLGAMTWDAVGKYASHASHGELYTVLSTDSLIRAS
jgi:hypothetical protein